MKAYRLLFFDTQLPFLLKETAHPTGGACVRNYALIKGIVSLGHKVGILTWKGAREYIPRDVEFDVIESYTKSKGSQKLRWIYHIYPALYKAIKLYRPDIVFQTASGLVTGVIAFISKRLDTPFVHMAANDVDADGRYKTRLRYTKIKFYEYGIRNSEKIIVQNSYQKREFSKKWKDKKIAIIHNAFYYKGKLPEIKQISERTYIAWVGVFKDQKNLPALLNIINKLPSREFRIAGTFNYTYSNDIKKTVSDITNCKNVRMLGYITRNEVIPFLAGASVLLNTSLYEGFSNTFLESFAAGTPVITNCIDPDNIITNNGLGIVTQSYDQIPDKLTEIIYRSDYNQMARRCRDYVLKNHDRTKIAEIFIESIKTIKLSQTG
jgi:glycosyltransferase involved in cell wall biosynthesis